MEKAFAHRHPNQHAAVEFGWLLTVITAMVLFLYSGNNLLAQDSIKEIIFRGVHVQFYEVQPGQGLRFFWKQPDGSFYGSLAAVQAELERQGIAMHFATNGGMYHPDRHPVGLYVEDGKELSPLNLEKGWGNFFLRPNGIFAVTDKGPVIMESRRFYNRSKRFKVYQATQSGPLLLHNGRIHRAFRSGSKNLLIRSGVGITHRDRVIFAISKDPVNLHTFARLFRDRFKADNALYLDGDSSQIMDAVTAPAQLFGPIIAVVEPPP